MHLLQHVSKPLILGEEGNLDVHSSSQSSAKVGGTGQDEAKMLIPHEFMA